MAEGAAINVKGLLELNRALKFADRETRLGIRKQERELVKPVKLDAEQLAVREISHIGKPWSTMRIGITQKLVYVAPKQRGSKARRAAVSPRRRLSDQRFAGRLMDEAMQPALDRNVEKIEKGFEDVLEHMADNFNKGP